MVGAGLVPARGAHRAPQQINKSFRIAIEPVLLVWNYLFWANQTEKTACKPYERNSDGISETYVRCSALSWVEIVMGIITSSKFVILDYLFAL